MKTAHEIWSYLNEKYGTVSDDDYDEFKYDGLITLVIVFVLMLL